ncbi:MAG: hypothetical protein ACOYYU_17040 [Chloroflexota bacterium]
MESQKRLSLFLTKSPGIKWGIVLGLTTVYVLSFRAILAALGPAGTPLVALPVMAAGWHFRLSGGDRKPVGYSAVSIPFRSQRV